MAPIKSYQIYHYEIFRHYIDLYGILQISGNVCCSGQL